MLGSIGAETSALARSPTSAHRSMYADVLIDNRIDTPMHTQIPECTAKNTRIRTRFHLQENANKQQRGRPSKTLALHVYVHSTTQMPQRIFSFS